MEAQKANITIILVAALTGILVSVLAADLLASSQRIQTSGSIAKTVNIGVYSDSACTQNLTNINWGSLAIGGSTTQTIWIKNLGNTRVRLNMTTDNWSSATARSYISLSWNVEGTTLNAASSVQATLTLTVSTAIAGTGITSFSFDIIITGTEYT